MTNDDDDNREHKKFFFALWGDTPYNTTLEPTKIAALTADINALQRLQRADDLRAG